jgi:hypothetical protein
MPFALQPGPKPRAFVLIIDIHPHVISTDMGRYPRAPIGGHQSDWSKDRPVSYEQMIVEQDRAGVSKAALWMLTKSVALYCARKGGKRRCPTVTCPRSVCLIRMATSCGI